MFLIILINVISTSYAKSKGDVIFEELEQNVHAKRKYPPPTITSVNVYDVCYATVPKSSCYKNAPTTGCFNTNKYTTLSCTTSSSDSIVLTMRVFEPITTDTSKKPVLIYVQGGGYASGNGWLSGGTGLRAWSNSTSDVNYAFCEYFARQGYVVVAVDYRKGWDTKGAKCIGGTQCDNCACEAAANTCESFTFMKANYRMVQDIRAAHRKVIELRSTLNVDTDEVYYFGNSTGAVGVLHAAFGSDDMPSYKKTTSSSSPTLSSELGSVDAYGPSVSMSLFKVAGVYSIAGAIRDVSWIEASDSVRKAVIVFGDEDNAVLPCDGPILNLGYVTESSPNFNHLSLVGSVGIYNRLKDIYCDNNPTCGLALSVRFENVGHGLYGDLLKPMKCGESNTYCGSSMSNDKKIFYAIDTFISGADNIYSSGYRGGYHIYVNNADQCKKCFYTSPTTLNCSTSGSVYRINNSTNEVEEFEEYKKSIDDNYFLYPNPSNSEININIFDDDILEVNIVDITGRKIATFGEFAKGVNTYNVNHLPNGNYICNIIKRNSEIISHKFIKN